MAPLASAGSSTTAARPNPRSRNEASMLAWRSSLARTRMGGEPASPRSSTSQPACSSTRCRAAASPTVLAPVAPVTNPNEAGSGIPSRSFNQTPAASSTRAAAGEVREL